MEHLDRLAPGWSDAVGRALPWRPPDGSYLVVAPHPDDESLMFGGHLARLATRGTPVHLVAVTDGEAAYPDAVDGAALAPLRRKEQAGALAALGLGGATVTRLGIPDGGVTAHEARIAEAIASLIADRRIDVVLAPWVRDHHADHEACGRAARRALAGAVRPVTLVSGLFWAMLRGGVDEHVDLHALSLTVDERARKRAAIECHRTQVASTVSDVPVLGEVELSITQWAREHVIVQGVDSSPA